MQKLIYHNPNSEVSNFDETIKSMIRECNSLKIACPYLNKDYVDSLLLSCDKWQIISDIRSWILSMDSEESSNELLAFLRSNLDKIRHSSDLHAKVIITQNSAIIGSSNFTTNGIFKNNELSVLLNEEKDINELNSWFETSWLSSSPLSDALLENFIANKQNTNVYYNIPSHLKFTSPPQLNITLSHYNVKQGNIHEKVFNTSLKEEIAIEDSIENLTNDTSIKNESSLISNLESSVLTNKNDDKADGYPIVSCNQNIESRTFDYDTSSNNVTKKTIAVKRQIAWGYLCFKIGYILFFIAINVLPCYFLKSFATLLPTGILTLMNGKYIIELLTDDLHFK